MIANLMSNLAIMDSNCESACSGTSTGADPEIPYIAGNFCLFCPSSHGRIFYSTNFLSHVNDYIEPMATFTTWTKIYFTEYIFLQR